METQLATWQEIKKWLNLDFDDNQEQVEAMACGIEGYLTVGTGLRLDTLETDSPTAYTLARSYLQQKLYAQYYGVTDEHIHASCQAIIDQLKVMGLMVVQNAE